MPKRDTVAIDNLCVGSGRSALKLAVLRRLVGMTVEHKWAIISKIIEQKADNAQD